MAAWLAVEASDAEELAPALPDAATLALEALDAASTADADGLIAGAAHDVNIVTQQHKAMIPVSIRFMMAPFPITSHSNKVDSESRSFAFISIAVCLSLRVAASQLPLQHPQARTMFLCSEGSNRMPHPVLVRIAITLRETYSRTSRIIQNPKSSAVAAIFCATGTPKGQRLSQSRQPMHACAVVPSAR